MTSNATIGIPLLNARAVDGTDLSERQQGHIGPNRAGMFKLVATPNGAFALVGDSPKGNGHNVIDTAILPVVVPPNYVADSNALAIKLNVATVSGQTEQKVRSDSTVSLKVSRPNADGSVDSIPVITAPQKLPDVQTINASAAIPSYTEYTFEIDGSLVDPGDVLSVYVETQLGLYGTLHGPAQTRAMICAAQLVVAVQNYQSI